MARARACPGTGVELAVATSTGVGAAALARLVSSSGTDTSAAFVATALVGFAVAALFHRTRVSMAVGAVVTTLAVAAVATWFAALDAAGSFPTGSAFGALPGDLRAARSQLAAFTVPLHAGAGLVLLGSVLCGMAGLVARLLLGPFGKPTPRSHPALALLPALGLVVWSCLARPGSSAAVVCGALALGAVAALALPTEQAAAERPARQRWAVGAVVAALVAAVATVGIGLPFGGASTAPSHAPSVVSLSLTTGLLTVERQDANDVLFRAHSSIPTYWQVAVLTRWRDDHWVTGPANSDPSNPVGGRQLLPTAPGAHRIRASVTVAGWSSRLLPVPPSVVSVTAAGAVVNANGVVAPQATARTTTYRSTSVALTVGPRTKGTFTGMPASTQAALTALPPVPAAVRNLALTITAGAPTSLGKAEELVNWLRSDTYHYTLTPPAAAPGTDPLVDFLFTTRSGSCESFAGAFAVMARLVGLPTRVAVGFTSGKLATDGSYVVTGADAHAWPEVYLGRSLGWVSFEPTPGQASGSIAPPDVVGTSATSVAPLPAVTIFTPPSTPTPTSPPPIRVAPSRLPAATQHSKSTSSSREHRAGGSGSWWWLLAGLFAVACVAIGVVRRRRRRVAAPAEERVVNAYCRAERALRAAGLARPPWCTPAAHAAWLLAAADRWRSLGPGPGGDQLRAALVDLGTLTQLVERAGYDPAPTTPTEASAAEEAATRVRRTFARRSVRRLARSLGAPSPRATASVSR